MRRPFRVLLLSLACSASLAAQAQASTPINIPAGDLVPALDSLARQSGAQFVYRADQLRGVRTSGVQGAKSPQDAVDRLLQGSEYVAQRDASGAMVIVKRTPPAKPKPVRQVSMLQAPPATPEPAPAVQELDTVQVTGSRIPRAQIEGPAPITVITAEDILAGGFTSVPDVMQSLTQNNGETQSQQSAGGADFSPGAQQVDLRGLGPNHTLVLVNGRRIADFPLPFGGRSNFTDISSIPLGMIDRIEVLTGSASAIYGSDAISGVVNFILKKEADGITVDYRFGQTSRSDAESFQLNVSGGFSSGNFGMVAGVEYRQQKPLWGFQRSQQDSSFDGPTTNSQVPPRNFLITDWWDDYIDPGEEVCNDQLGHLNEGTMQHAFRPRYGYFCGSDRAPSYRTSISRREGFNGYASMHYDFANGTEWFADIQGGRHEVSLFRAPRSWWLMTPDGIEWDYFNNQNTGQLEYWQRQFTLEEMGGLGNGMVNTTQKTFGITTGFKGVIAKDWDYEAAFSHSQYKADISWPQIIAARANELFLGPLLGYDEDGYPIYDADPERMYTPLTRDEYNYISAYTTYKPESESQTLSFTVAQVDLFELQGGAAGFAATAELGRQSYSLNPDPRALEYYYTSWKDSDGEGSRNRWALAGELRMPVLDTLNVSVAGRYDQYRFAGRDPAKFTWSTGLEWRPLDSLLVRGSYGTAFRAPDLHYVFSGPGNDETSVADYYRCATEEPDEDIDDCSYGDEGIIRSRAGNRDLNPETSTSWTIGTVWSPTSWLDMTLDWYDIDMRDQVEDLRTSTVMLNELDCRTGVLPADSALCVDTLARITRMQDGSLYGVHVNPINVARETTDGLDFSANLRWETRLGNFGINAGYTWVNSHEIQVYPDEPVVDMFSVNSGYDIPRSKANLRLSWSKDAWSASLQGRRLGSLPNGWSYDQVWEEGDPGPTIPATYRYNLNMQYMFSDHSRLAFTVVNLFDTMPPADPTYTAYPYYDISWFDTMGRTYYLQYTHKFGGAGL
jgi:outer membrane receptor protein involved in Fe transport